MTKVNFKNKALNVHPQRAQVIVAACLQTACRQVSLKLSNSGNLKGHRLGSSGAPQEINTRPRQERQQHGIEIQQGYRHCEKKVETLELKNLINQIKTTVDSTISRQDQTEERLSEVENKIEEILHTDNHKDKNEYL
jgi:hypothetical protein